MDDNISEELCYSCKDCPDYDQTEETCRSHGGCAQALNPVGGIYEDMIHRVYDAYDELLKEHVMANTVIINGKKYGRLADFMYNHTYIKGPVLFGMSMGVDMKMDDDFDFWIANAWHPPRTDYDKLKSDYDALKEKYEDIKELMNKIGYIMEEC